MEMVNIRLGKVALRAPSSWLFSISGEGLLGRRETMAGFLRILVPDQFPAEDCEQSLLDHGANLAGIPQGTEPFSQRPETRPDRLFGAASYRFQKDGRDFLSRIWYLKQDDLGLFAVYACPWDRYQDPIVHEELSQSDRIILGIQPYVPPAS